MPAKKRYKRYLKKSVLILVLWSIAVVGSLIININSAYKETLAKASVAAESTTNRDIGFRSWAASKGGVYVTPTETTPSNPYLINEFKDTFTQEGLPLTLLNPAYLLRDIHNHLPNLNGITTRLVSTLPINPINQANEWEAAALNNFLINPMPVTYVFQEKEEPKLQRLQPFVVEPSCMSCHAHQGYKVGEVRGGITTIIPLKPYLKSFDLRKNKLYINHLGIWFLGFLVFLTSCFHERKSNKLQNKHLKELQLASEFFEQSYEGILITDAQANIVDLNSAFERMSGYSKAELLGMNPKLLKSGWQSPETYQSLWQDLSEKGFWKGETWNKRKDGSIYAVAQSISAIYSDDVTPKVRNYLSISTDITPAKENEKKLQYLAHYDPLTGLPNRFLLTKKIEQAIQNVKKNKGLLVLAYLDLDGFKKINDLYSHDVGDLVLIHLSEKMKGIIGSENTLARIGGDEFVVIINNLTSEDESKPLLNSLLKVCSSTTRVAGHTIKLSASIGVNFYPSDKVDAEQLLRHSDQAMYAAKQAGKNCYIIFDTQLDEVIRNHSALIKEVQQAINHNEFELFYQPKINSRTNQVVGAEALIRWNHPLKGLMAPGQFLPDIENHIIMQEVGRWVMKTAANQLRLWQKNGITCPISINMNSELLQEGSFNEELALLLNELPSINTNSLEIEVLETTAVEDFNIVSATLLGINNLGVQISIDDFGTGYSSLSYLKHLTVNTLKIDQSFVRDLLDDPDDLAIVQSIISMAEAFKLQVIAEGVETKVHADKLLELGCELVQGYGVSKPLPISGFMQWLEEWEKNPQWLA